MIASNPKRSTGFAAGGAGLVLAACCAAATLAGCAPDARGKQPPIEPQEHVASLRPDKRREIRASGVIQAVRYQVVQTPRISGKGARLTLVELIPNGALVQKGDLVAVFDPTDQMEAQRVANAQYEDLGHQAEQKLAENEAEAAKRRLLLREAEAELAEAEIELRKGPLLSEIDRLKNEAKASAAKAKVESLTKSSLRRDEAEAAALLVLQLQRDRQKVALDRAESNLSKLSVVAPIGGMVALEPTWRNGSMGPAQEGDQLSPGRPLLRIFDPSEMEILANVAETDRAALDAGLEAVVELDAYPDLHFPARLEAASPVAATAIGSPIKTFLGRFRLLETDPRLLPDLSGVVVVQVEDP